MKVDAQVLGLVQMTTTAVLGAVKVYGFPSAASKKPRVDALLPRTKRQLKSASKSTRRFGEIWCLWEL